MLTILSYPGSLPRQCSQSRVPLTVHPSGADCPAGLIVPGASHKRIALDARPGRIPIAEYRVINSLKPILTNTCATSCRTLTKKSAAVTPTAGLTCNVFIFLCFFKLVFSFNLLVLSDPHFLTLTIFTQPLFQRVIFVNLLTCIDLQH